MINSKLYFLLSLLLIQPVFAHSPVAGSNRANASAISMEGRISHERANTSDKAVVSLTALPKSFDEFKKLYQQAAVEPQGAAALFVVALTMYKDNPVEGERAIAYTLYDKFSSDPDKINPHDRPFFKQKLLNNDSYAQPYIATAYYEGATPANNYTPSKPYRIKVQVHPRQNYQPLSRAQAMVIPLQIKSYGYDWNNNANRLHGIAVLKPANSRLYQVFSYKDLLTGVLAPNLK